MVLIIFKNSWSLLLTVEIDSKLARNNESRAIIHTTKKYTRE